VEEEKKKERRRRGERGYKDAKQEGPSIHTFPDIFVRSSRIFLYVVGNREKIHSLARKYR
jgi:hypothetical protein